MSSSFTTTGEELDYVNALLLTHPAVGKQLKIALDNFDKFVLTMLYDIKKLLIPLITIFFLQNFAGWVLGIKY